MFKKSLICLLLVFCFSLPALAQDSWVLMGKTAEGFEVWMNGDIKPVAYNDDEGKIAVLRDIFTFDYKLVYAGNEVALTGFYDLQAQKLLSSISKNLVWEDEGGADGFLYDAYLLKDYFTIMGKEPFVLKREFVPKVRKASIFVDKDGWQEVNLKGSTKAWIQTKSAQISNFDGDDLPKVRILVRYASLVDGKQEVSFAYECYDPATREKVVLKKWDADGKEILMPEQEISSVKVLSKEATIASAAYSLFVLDYSKIEKRGQFAVEEEKVFFPKHWFGFANKEK